jgi:hypothetical protein
VFLGHENPRNNTGNVTFSSQMAILATWFFYRYAMPAFDRPQERNDLYYREGNPAYPARTRIHYRNARHDWRRDRPAYCGPAQYRATKGCRCHPHSSRAGHDNSRGLGSIRKVRVKREALKMNVCNVQGFRVQSDRVCGIAGELVIQAFGNSRFHTVGDFHVHLEVFRKIQKYSSSRNRFDSY